MYDIDISRIIEELYESREDKLYSFKEDKLDLEELLSERRI